MNLQKRGSQGNKLGASSSSSKRTTRGRETRFEHIFPDSSDRNVPTTSSLHTSSANSSYRPSLSGTPPQTPINISNKCGISCYMDSVIQCLYWTPGFTEMLLSARPRLLNENKNISGYYWDSRYTFQIFREDHSRKSGRELLLLPEGFWRILIALNFLYVIQCYFNNKINLVEEYTKKLIYNLRIYFFKKTGKQGEQDSQDFLSDLFDILTNTYYERDKVTKSEVKVNTAPVPDTVQEAIKENESTQIHS